MYNQFSRSVPNNSDSATLVCRGTSRMTLPETMTAVLNIKNSSGQLIVRKPVDNTVVLRPKNKTASWGVQGDFRKVIRREGSEIIAEAGLVVVTS